MAKKTTTKKQKSIEETLWDSANKLRGTVESSEYKHVVLSLIFLKFASDKFEERKRDLINEGKEKYLEMKEFYNMKNVFFLPQESRWSYLIENAKQDDIALKIDKINHIDRTLQDIEANKTIAFKDINVLIQNLNNLKKDINNSSGNRAKYSENIEAETSRQIILVNAVDDYFSDCTNSLQLFNEIKLDLISFSNKLKVKNEEQNLIP